MTFRMSILKLKEKILHCLAWLQSTTLHYSTLHCSAWLQNEHGVGLASCNDFNVDVWVCWDFDREKKKYKNIKNEMIYWMERKKEDRLLNE